MCIISYWSWHVRNKFGEWASNATIAEFGYVTLSFSPFAYVSSKLQWALDTYCSMSMTFGKWRDAVSIEVVVLGFVKIMVVWRRTKLEGQLWGGVWRGDEAWALGLVDGRNEGLWMLCGKEYVGTGEVARLSNRNGELWSTGCQEGQESGRCYSIVISLIEIVFWDWLHRSEWNDAGNVLLGGRRVWMSAGYDRKEAGMIQIEEAQSTEPLK